MSKLSSFPPFSPAKGKIPMDPAFEFEAPRYCDLQDDKYDFYEDYEKNTWFEETHWLHEPPEKRPLSDRAKRKSVVPNNLAAAAAVAKRQLAALMSVTTRGEDEIGKEDGRGRSGSFERDANFSPSRIFAPVSENELDLKRARSGTANSPMKFRGPERILFRRDSNKENVENEDFETDTVKDRKSSGRISDGRSKELAGDGHDKPLRSDGNDEKAKSGQEEGKISISRKSAGKDVGEAVEQKRKSTEVKARKSGDGKALVEKARRKSTVSRLEEKENTGRNSGGNKLKTLQKTENEKLAKVETGKTAKRLEANESTKDSETIKTLRKMETDTQAPKEEQKAKKMDKSATKTEAENQVQKIRARKSISSLAFLNSHSTTYSIPNKLIQNTSPITSNPPVLPSTSLPSQKPKSDTAPLSSTLPFLDGTKLTSSLPMRATTDGNEDAEEITSIEGQEEEQREERLAKRKSDEALVSEKLKRTRSSIMTCPVPAKSIQKKAPPVVEKPNLPLNKDNKAVKTKRKSFEFELDDEIAAKLEKHNKKFKPMAAYVPRNFSTKDVKMWEEYSGKKWYSLTSAEREEANDWIKHTKAQMQM